MQHAWLRVNTTLNHADLARLVPGIQPATDEEWLQRHHTVLQLKKTVASHHAPLSANQQRSTEQWIRTLDPSHATLVQIGANLHQSTSYANSDPGPQCVALGWCALLLEPAPPIFARLRAKYSNRTRYRRVRTVNAAVCDQCGSEPVPFWHVDTSNATGNWGSLHADARCLPLHDRAIGRRVSRSVTNGEHVRLEAIDTFISEISSLSASHLVQFQRLYTTQRGPCALCGQLLAGRAYDASCSSRVIRDNMRSTTVRCYCMRQELPWEHVSLLTIGAHTH